MIYFPIAVAAVLAVVWAIVTSHPKRRVSAGATLLDKRFPGWYKHINLQRLDILNCDRCILGQLYGNYSYGKQEIGLGIMSSGWYGFHPDPFRVEETKRLWAQAVEARRASA